MSFFRNISSTRSSINKENHSKTISYDCRSKPSVTPQFLTITVGSGSTIPLRSIKLKKSRTHLYKEEKQNILLKECFCKSNIICTKTL